MRQRKRKENWFNAVGLITLCLSLLLFPKYLLAQSIQTKVKFDRLGVDQGLSNNHVTCITQDLKGYLWVGTENGLNRYDGYQFISYYNIPGDSNSFLNNYIKSVFEDSQGTLWVSTEETGLYYYNRKLDNFIPVKAFLKNCQIETIKETSKKELCVIGLRNGFAFSAIFDRGKRNWKIYNIQASKQPISAIVSKSDNTYWIAIKNTGLFEWNRLTNTLSENISIREKISTRIDKIKDDTFGNIWFASRDGLYKLDGITKKYSVYYHADPASLHNSLPVNRILDIEQDDKYLWIGTENGGLSRLNIFTNKISTFITDKKDPFSIGDNSIWAVYKDHQNRIWTGTYSYGLSVYDKLKYKFQELDIPLDNDIVNAVLKDNKNRIWVGTEGGIKMKDGSKLFTFKHDIRNNGSIDNDPILSLFQDSKNEIWVGTWDGGLNRFNEKTMTFQHYESLRKHRIDIYDANVFSILEQKSTQRLLTGGYQGLNILPNYQTDHFTNYVDTTSLINNYIHTICEDNNGFIWLGSISQLNRLDLKTGERLRFYYDTVSGSGIYVNAILEDSKQRLWVGTNQGLKLLINSKPRASYTIENGLPTNVIKSIVEDNSGNLWLCTTKGLSKFNTDTNTFINYDIHDGLLSNEFKDNSSFKAKNGEIYLGNRGVLLFHPDSIKSNQFLPTVVITDLKIFNKSIKIGDTDKILKHHISESKEITLAYSNAVITLDFVALNFTASNKNQFSYILNGFDKEWTDSGNKRSATYTNLDPGTYTFRVKASNNDGVWNTEGASLIIHILPPWWATWWFRLGIVLILIATLALIYQMRIRSKYVSTLIQLTNKLESEKHMVDFLMDNLPVQIYLKDRDSRFVRISKYMALYFNVGATDLVGKTDFDIQDKLHAQKAFEDEQEIIQTGKSKERYYEKEIHTDGNERWVSTVKLPLRNTTGEIIGTFGISTDVTQLRQQNDELLLREEEIKSQNEELHTQREELSLQNEKLNQSQEEIADQNQRLQASEEELTQNIEELKATQDALEARNRVVEATEKQLRQIFDGVPAMIFQLKVLKNQTMHFTAVSKGSRSLFNLEPDTLLANSENIFNTLHPEDNKVYRQGLIDFSNNTNSVFKIELRSYVAGKLTWIQSSAAPEKIDNESVLWSGIILDISKRKQAEADLNRTREILQQTNNMARVGGWELDLITRILHWSEVTKEIHEVPSNFQPSLLTGINFYKKGESRIKIDEVIKMAINDGISFDEKLQIKTAKGNEVWVRAIGKPEFTNGKCTRIYGAFQDIDQQVKANHILETQQKALSEQNDKLIQNAEEISSQHDQLFDQNEMLRNAQTIIEEQNQEIRSRNLNLEDEVTKRTKEIIEYNHQLEQFAFISAHNLRAPVARILGLGQILRLPNQPANEKDDLVHKLINTTIELDTVVKDLNQILEVKKDSNQPIVQLNLNQELMRVEIILQHEIDTSHATIKKDFTRVETIKTVKPYLDSIITNLVSNAIKYRHPRRDLQIEINSKLVGEYICIEFSDNGLGIDLEIHKEKLFNLYKRFHFHVEGKGLGLYLVKTQIDSLGGKIEVESTVDHGTTFRIYFKQI